MNEHRKPINTIEFSEDSEYIATGSNDMKIKIWDLNLDKMKKHQQLFQNNYQISIKTLHMLHDVSTVKFGDDHKLYIGCEDGSVRI